MEAKPLLPPAATAVALSVPFLLARPAVLGAQRHPRAGVLGGHRQSSADVVSPPASRRAPATPRPACRHLPAPSANPRVLFQLGPAPRLPPTPARDFSGPEVCRRARRGLGARGGETRVRGPGVGVGVGGEGHGRGGGAEVRSRSQRRGRTGLAGTGGGAGAGTRRGGRACGDRGRAACGFAQRVRVHLGDLGAAAGTCGQSRADRPARAGPDRPSPPAIPRLRPPAPHRPVPVSARSPRPVSRPRLSFTPPVPGTQVLVPAGRERPVRGGHHAALRLRTSMASPRARSSRSRVHLSR